MDAITTKDWADYCHLMELEANGLSDFYFDIRPWDEPEMGCTHTVVMYEWGTNAEMEHFTTDDPYGAVEAAREAQHYTLEERLDRYAEMGL